MSWFNFAMDLATIPKTETSKKSDDQDVMVPPEDEEAELRKLLRQ